VSSSTSKPALFLTSSEWSALPQKLSDPFFGRILSTNAQAIDCYSRFQGAAFFDLPGNLGDPASPRTSNASARPLKGRLLRSAIALNVARDESAWAFASESIDHLLNPDFWRPNIAADKSRIRHFDLKMGDLLFCASFVLETFAGRLDAARRDRLIDLTINRGLAAYLKGWEAEEWWRTANFNWSPSTNGNAGLAALAIADIDPKLSENILGKAREGVGAMIANLPLDGWWTEGSMYQTTAFGHLCDFVIALHNTRGDDLGLSKNPRWIEALDNRPYSLAPDGRILNFSNCPEGTTEQFCPQIYWWAERLGRPEWTAFEDSICKPWSDTFGLFYDIEAFLYRSAHTSLPPLPPLRPIKHFRGLDWLTWRGAGTWLAFRGGNNGGNHNNADLGHFILGRGKTRYLVDPGYGFRTTVEHNTVSIHGRDQTEGAVAPILSHGSVAGGFHLACDLAACHPYVLSKHLRILLLLGDAHLLVIDSIVGRDGTRVGARYHFHTALPALANDDGFVIDGSDGRLSITSLTPTAPPLFEVVKAQYAPLSRLGFYADADRPEELSIFLLSFTPAHSTPPSVTRSNNLLAVKWDRRSYTVNIDDGSVIET
jgi:hypothetical protein